MPAVHNKQQSLQPSLALLQKIVNWEGAFFPHFPLDEIKGIAVPLGHHAKVIVFGYTAIRAMVEGHLSLGPHLKYNTHCINNKFIQKCTFYIQMILNNMKNVNKSITINRLHKEDTP